MDIRETGTPRDDQTDAKLRGLFKKNAPPADEARMAAALRPEAALPSRVATTRTPKQTPRRRKLRAVGMTAGVVILAAAIGVGTWQAAARLGGSDSVIVITDHATSTGPTAAADLQAQLTDGTWEFQVDRQADLQDVNLPSDQLAETDYQPIEDAPTFTVTISEDGAKTDISGTLRGDQLSLAGARKSVTVDRISYDLEAFAGGRFVVWREGMGLQAEFTEYGSGVPIVQSYRGSLAKTAADGTPDLLAMYTTVYEGSLVRQTNVKVAAQYAGDVLLRPNQEYDLDQLLGPRTREQGWSIPVGSLVSGTDLQDSILEGAITQVATTLFNAAFEAGLKITERHNASIYIAHYPEGREAAIAAGSKNLRFINDTAHDVWIVGESDGITTKFSIYGTSDGRKVRSSKGEFYNIVPKTTVTELDSYLPESKTQIAVAGQDGRALDVRRTVTLPDGTVLHDDVFKSAWPMYPEEIRVGTSTK